MNTVSGCNMEIMKKIFLFLLISLSLVLFGKDGMAEYVPGEILVKFKDTSDTLAIKKLHLHIGSVKKKEFNRIKVHHVKLPQNVSVEEAVQYYKQDPNVEYAEPNYIVHATATPDDPSFGSLWGLNNTGQTGGTIDADIDAPEAWDHTTGSTDVIIAVIDSGVAYDHPDLSENIWTNTGETNCTNGIDDDHNDYVDDCKGWDFFDNDNDPSDYNEHGTHVAGTIAAVGDNSTGISGVMWQARIMPLRFLDISGSGSTSDAIAASLYAKNNGAHIINNSWGGTGYSQALKDAINDFPGIVVCAAGNDGTSNDGSLPSYPASYTSSNIISVAATDHNDSLASFSNYGARSVDLAAPGAAVVASNTGIYSTVPARETILLDNFNDGNLSSPNWTTGGSLNTWTVSSGSLVDSPADYQNNTNSWVQTDALSFSGKEGCKLSYEMKIDTLTSDVLYVEASLDNINWTTISSYSGTTFGEFIDFVEDLTGYDGELTVYIRYRLETNSSAVDDGAYIDDVEITCASNIYDGTEYKYYQGTSMAAPHVSGVAGLIKALLPGLSTAQIKDAILKSIDAKSSLKGKILTGGRLNANKAIEYALSPYAPTGLSAVVVSPSQVDLSWTDNCAATAYHANEEGFIIERNGGDGASFSQIASVGPDITSYSDTGLTGAIYYYRIRVFGADLGDYANSNEAGVMTRPSSGSSSDNGGGGGGGGGGGSCFIATAAYGSIMHPYVKALREFRDGHLLTNTAGKTFVALYYKYSPPIADVIRDHEYLKFITRVILTPAVMFVVFPFTSSIVFVSLIIALMLVLKRNSKYIKRL